MYTQWDEILFEVAFLIILKIMAACSCGHLKNQGDKFLSKLRVELSKKEIFFVTKIGLKKDVVFIFYFDSYLWSSFEYKKLVR